ncbi:MAG: hypothetical protein ACHBNF_18340 [Chromatiales bacterium]
MGDQQPSPDDAVWRRGDLEQPPQRDPSSDQQTLPQNLAELVPTDQAAEEIAEDDRDAEEQEAD